MPNKFLAVREAIKDCSSPVMVFLSKGEVASQSTTLKAFSNGEISIVSNIDKLFDPVEGGNLPVIETSAQTVEGETFNQFDSLVTMKCSECKVMAGVDPDLAFAISGEQLHCLACGKEAAYAYDETEVAEDNSEEETSDEDLGDVNEEEPEAIEDEEDLGDELTSEDDEEGGEEEFDDVEDTSEEESETAAAAEVAEEAPVVEQVETIQAPIEAPAAVAELVEQEVHAASLADENAAVKLVTMTNDNSEIAVFVGQTHVGLLRRTMASEKAAPLFDNGQKLVAAFKPVFNANRTNQTSGELAHYGYTPVSFKVNIDKMFEERLANEVATVKAAAEAEVASKIGNMTTLIELAFVGINKGFFESKNDLAGEIASLLGRNGVANPEKEARRILAKHSHNYIKSGVEKAKELSSHSPDYLRGITETISKSEFTVTETSVSETASHVPSQPRVREIASEDFIGKRQPNVSDTNRYRGVIRAIGR